MSLSPHCRFEGSVFFVYDHEVLQKEEDLLEDAIIYFYPHSMPLDNQCLLCGQLMGLVQFSDTMFGSSPILYRFKKEKIVVKHVGQYTFALAGSNIEPDSMLIEQIDRLYSLFAFYHGSVDQIKLDCDNDREMFSSEMSSLWEQYLAFIRNYGDNLPSVFNPVPYVPLKDVQNSCFLKALHILQACQRRPKVIAGCILYNRYILCSQLLDSISRCLLLLKPNQHHHPAIPLDTDFQLPFGVRLFNVYLQRNDLDQLLEQNENSPYKPGLEKSPFLKCCCRRKRSIHRNQRKPPRELPSRSTIYDSGQHSMLASERDPISSSSSAENTSTLCKAMLEDLILKGFKCCKCVEDQEGELEEGNGDEKSVADVVLEIKGKNNETKKVSENEVSSFTEQLGEEIGIDYEQVIPEDEEVRWESEGSVGYSRQSIITGESGIEVTGSDLHSSTATPFEQRSECVHHVSGQIRQGTLAMNDEECGTSRDTERLQRMYEDFEDLGNFLQTNKAPVSHGECNGLDSSPEDIEGQHGISCGDKPPTGTLDGSSGLQHVDDTALLKTSKDDLGSLRKRGDDLGSLRTPGGDLGSMKTPRDDLGSKLVAGDNVGSHGISGGDQGSHSGFESGFQNEVSRVVSKNDGGFVDDNRDSQVHCRMSGSEERQKTALNNLTAERKSETEMVDEEKIKKDIEDDQKIEGDNEERESQKTPCEHVFSSKCCEVDGLIHANLFVQAHSEIVLILLTDCDLAQNEDIVKSLWNTSLSELGELDILLRHSFKVNREGPQVPYNYLIYDNFEKTMSGNLKEPVFAIDHVFCDTAKTLHAHFENAPQLVDVTLRNFHTGIYGRRTLTKEVYFQENMVNPLSSQRHQPQDASSYLEKKVGERLLKDRGLHLV